MLDMMNALGRNEPRQWGGAAAQYGPQMGGRNFLDALRGRLPQFPRDGVPQNAQPQAPGQQSLPTQIAPIPLQQSFQAPQAPPNMVGQSYGVRGMQPAANPYGLPTY